MSRKLARQASSGLSAADRAVIAGFIKRVARDAGSMRIIPSKRHRSRQDHPTPWAFMSALTLRFGDVAIDLAATKSNSKAKRFISPRENSLKQDWKRLLNGEIGYLNPPFDPITPWVDKVVDEAIKGTRFVMLTQASVDSNWFWKMFPYCTSYALRPRLTFIGSKDAFPKPLILSAFNCVRLGAEAGPCGRLHRWNWLIDAEGAEAVA